MLGLISILYCIFCISPKLDNECIIINTQFLFNEIVVIVVSEFSWVSTILQEMMQFLLWNSAGSIYEFSATKKLYTLS